MAHELVLTGLDGANPLAFFAALGTLEALADRGLPVRLHWRDEGVWRPVLTGVDGGLSDVVAWLDQDRISCREEPALGLEYDGNQDLKPAPALFRRYLQNLVSHSSPDQRRGVDWAAAFATDVAVGINGNTKPTALHFTAGQQQFLRMVNDLIEGVRAEDLHEALAGPWRYARPLPVMGWDSTMARDYALRASRPSDDKKEGVPGADWLAVRGLAELSVVPVGSRVLTTGCVGSWKSGQFRWGLWTVPLAREVVRSALRMGVVDMPAAERAARGIGVVFQCGIKRHEIGGRGSFEPATVV